MSEPMNPDVAWALKTQRDTCKHPVERMKQKIITVGSGNPDAYGSHLERRWVCGDCGCEFSTQHRWTSHVDR